MADEDRDSNFPTTHWTLVQVVKSKDPKRAAVALEELCSRYWYPIYAYLRRSGSSAHDAEDLTQMLFHKMLADDTLRFVQQERGKLRTYLIGLLRQVISKQVRHNHADKRGGGQTLLSLDETDADQRYRHEPADLRDPERLYEHAWAMQLLDTVRSKLRESFISLNRLADYEALEQHLGWENSPTPYAELAATLGSNENAVRVLVHRLRKKFRDLLEAEISKTVVEPEDVAREIEWMKEALRK
jgi:RNA polymerase sigma factor (sigma-70 family)